MLVRLAAGFESEPRRERARLSVAVHAAVRNRSSGRVCDWRRLSI